MEARSCRRRLLAHGGRALTLMAVIMTLGQGAAAWQIETVDDGDRMFTWMSEQSVVLDATGNPHLAYGGDHLYYTWYDGERWHYEIADCSDSVGAYASLALDAAGTPHISYIDSVNFAVKYAHKSGPGWLVETVDEEGQPITFNSVEVDSSGKPHICYVTSLSSRLRYAYRDTLGWSIEEVGRGEAGGLSLDLDGQGRPHVGYVSNCKSAYAWRDGAGWHTEYITSFDYWPEYMPSIEVDSLGRPHVTWHDMIWNQVKYAVRTDTGWQVESVGEGYPGSNTSLELDDQDYPHVVYDHNGLLYSYWDTSGWHTQGIPLDGDQASLALDSNGWPHATSRSYYSGPVMYARWNGTTWEITTVDECEGNTGFYTSLALTDAGQPIITYQDFYRGQTLYLAMYGPAGWSLEAVVPGAQWSSMKVDEADHVHLSYHDWPIYGSDHGLAYAKRTEAGWQFESVTDEHDNGDYSSLKLDTTGAPHIAFKGWTAEGWRVRCASKSSGTWTIENADVVTESPHHTSLALNSDDNPFIAFQERPDDDLMYVWNSGSGWMVETVDTEGHVGSQACLALGLDGTPHVAYFDTDNYDLKYAERAPSGWLVSTIDAAGRVGFYPSIVVDDGGWPHIAYLDGTNGNLKYAYRAPLSWHIEVIDSTGAVGGFPSLVLDDLGRPHISYYDSTNGALKYAWMDGPIELNLSGSLEGNELTLTWAPAIGTECWVYGTANEAFFVPGIAPDFEHRLAVLPQGTITWASASGVGDPATNWTYLVIAVDAMDQELCRSNRVGEFDFDVDAP